MKKYDWWRTSCNPTHLLGRKSQEEINTNAAVCVMKFDKDAPAFSQDCLMNNSSGEDFALTS